MNQLQTLSINNKRDIKGDTALARSAKRMSLDKCPERCPRMDFDLQHNARQPSFLERDQSNEERTPSFPARSTTSGVLSPTTITKRRHVDSDLARAKRKCSRISETSSSVAWRSIRLFMSRGTLEVPKRKRLASGDLRDRHRRDDAWEQERRAFGRHEVRSHAQLSPVNHRDALIVDRFDDAVPAIENQGQPHRATEKEERGAWQQLTSETRGLERSKRGGL